MEINRKSLKEYLTAINQQQEQEREVGIPSAKSAFQSLLHSSLEEWELSVATIMNEVVPK